MKKTFLPLIAISLIIFSFKTIVEDTYKLDVNKSKISWKGFKPTGSHYGSLMLKNGHFIVKDNQIIGGEFTIDMNSIVDLDMPADNEYNAKLVNHLKSEDFFGVEKHPTASFKITTVQPKEGKTLIKGDLTIKNITNTVAFLATVNNNGEVLHVKSETFKVDRSKWNVKYKSKSFFDDLADKFIYDDMEISFDLKASK